MFAHCAWACYLLFYSCCYEPFETKWRSWNHMNIYIIAWGRGGKRKGWLDVVLFKNLFNCKTCNCIALHQFLIFYFVILQKPFQYDCKAHLGLSATFDATCNIEAWMSFREVTLWTWHNSCKPTPNIFKNYQSKASN